jgi:hypothetical protein
MIPGDSHALHVTCRGVIAVCVRATKCGRTPSGLGPTTLWSVPQCVPSLCMPEHQSWMQLRRVWNSRASNDHCTVPIFAAPMHSHMTGFFHCRMCCSHGALNVVVGVVPAKMCWLSLSAFAPLHTWLNEKRPVQNYT